MQSLRFSAPSFASSWHCCDCVRLYGTVDLKKGRYVSGTCLVTGSLKSRDFSLVGGKRNQIDSKNKRDLTCHFWLKVWKAQWWGGSAGFRKHLKLTALTTWQPERKQRRQTYSYRNWIVPATWMSWKGFFPRASRQECSGQYFDFSLMRHWVENAAEPAQTSDCDIKNVFVVSH